MTITREDILAEMAAVLKKAADPRPGEEWVTRKELQSTPDFKGKDRSDMRRLLAHAIKRGVLECKTVRRGLVYYRVVKP